MRTGQKPVQSFLDERGLFRERWAPGGPGGEPISSGWQAQACRLGREPHDEEDDEGSHHTYQPRTSPPLQRFEIHSDRGGSSG